MTHGLLTSGWVGRLIRVSLIITTLATPLFWAIDGGSAGLHCRAHSPEAMAGMDHSGGGNAARSEFGVKAVADHHCSHCPPSDCRTTAPCSGDGPAVAIETTPSSWSTCPTVSARFGSTTRWFASAGFPPPTPPPQA